MNKEDLKYLNQITDWLYQWWGENEGYSDQSIRQYVYYGLNDHCFPYTFGLFEEDVLIGIYQIRLDDLFVRPDLYPWLANVYIDKKYRHLGYGKIMLESVKENALKVSNYSYLYLYTTHVQLYEKFGWEYLEDIDTHLLKPRRQKIYRLKVGESNG